MDDADGWPGRFRGTIAYRAPNWRAAAIVGAAAVFLRAGATPVPASAQEARGPAPLVFDRVTVIDVEQGTLVPNQRVVIAGNRIQAVGATNAVAIPKGAQVVPAKGKYLIPGLWDMHVHTSTDLAYPLFLANGVTGIRDASAMVPLDTMLQWRREILAGTRIGPPRQILSAVKINESPPGVCTWPVRTALSRSAGPGHGWRRETCIDRDDPADAQQLVDSLAAAGVDMLKPYTISTPATFFALARAARRRGLPFGGHQPTGGISAEEASDSGMRILDHSILDCGLTAVDVEDCGKLARRLIRNNTWVTPTQLPQGGGPEEIRAPFIKAMWRFWTGSALRGNWLAASARQARANKGWHSYLKVADEVGLPIVAGTDVAAGMSFADYVFFAYSPGFTLQAELAMYVAEGMTPLHALQTATLNPAKLLYATDSLGTVAAGKLADLILLDANPLEDITNTTTIRAVVANGRYFDRPALDRLLTMVRAQTKQGFRDWSENGPWLARQPLQFPLLHGSVTPPKPRAFLGVSVVQVHGNEPRAPGRSDTLGMRVTAVTPHTGAEAAGLMAGDLIVAVNGRPVWYANDWYDVSSTWKDGERVNVEIVRQGAARQTFRVTARARRPTP